MKHYVIASFIGINLLMFSAFAADRAYDCRLEKQREPLARLEFRTSPETGNPYIAWAESGKDEKRFGGNAKSTVIDMGNNRLIPAVDFSVHQGGSIEFGDRYDRWAIASALYNNRDTQGVVVAWVDTKQDPNGPWESSNKKYYNCSKSKTE